MYMGYRYFNRLLEFFLLLPSYPHLAVVHQDEANLSSVDILFGAARLHGAQIGSRLK
jgi:hypothetical protein